MAQKRVEIITAATGNYDIHYTSIIHSFVCFWNGEINVKTFVCWCTHCCLMWMSVVVQYGTGHVEYVVLKNKFSFWLLYLYNFVSAL